VADSTPWAPFAEGSLLANVKQVSLVAPPFQQGPADSEGRERSSDQG
jgi:hypothetical protein